MAEMNPTALQTAKPEDKVQTNFCSFSCRHSEDRGLVTHFAQAQQETASAHFLDKLLVALNFKNKD